MPRFATERAAQNPTAFALVDAGRELTWAEVGDALNRCANLLLAAGDDGHLGEAHRIAVFAENAAETALAHLGGLLAGASSVPVNFHLAASEAAYILSDSGSRILFVGPETAERGIAAAREAGVTTVIGWGCGDIEGIVDWNEWLAGGSPADPPGTVVPRPNLLYTSGTTGQPKGTELPPTMFAGGGDMNEHLERLALGTFSGFGTHLVVGPMYHTGPLSGMRLLCAGVPSVILARFDAEEALRVIDTYKTETTVMVPTHFVRMLALPDAVKAKYDVSSMKLIAHTGAKCPVDVKAAMIDWFGPVFRDAYGATEVGTVCSITSQEWLDHKGSVGRSVSPFSAVILDEAMQELPAGTEGQLFFRDATGRGIVYPNDSAKTASSNPEPGLFTLGEIGYMDADGYVFITDRFSDMVVSGGVNLYPAEAEQLLIDHPGVADVGCVGVPDPEMGEMLIALVIPTDEASPPDPDELSAWLRARLSHYKCPRRYHIVGDLKRNTMGKINKRTLRDAWLAGELVGEISVDDFTSQARAWFENNATPRVAIDATADGRGGSFNVSVFSDMSFEEEQAHILGIADWIQRKSTRGYHAVDWATKHGGLGLSRAHARALGRVEREFETPGRHELTSVTVGLIAPTIHVFGSDELKQRFIAPLLRAEILCCQLFSEPGAGSDLAGLSCRAERDGDEWVINGQKVWSSGAQFSQWGELIARTDPTVAKHKGLTAFMLPLDAPGVDVRPIKQMSGGSSFCEVFFDDVRIPDNLRLGEVGDGWNVATTTLSFERDHSESGAGGSALGGSFRQLLASAHQMGVSDDPVTRDKLVKVYIHSRIESFTNRRAADQARSGTPGPEGSLGKLLWTEGMNLVSNVVGDIIGAHLTADTGEWGTFAWKDHLLGAPGYRIAGGSDEVQRNILGERVLGLPREPRADTGPWTDIPR